MNRGLWGLGISLALGLIISSFVISQKLVEMKLANQVITVKGYAERKLSSDLAVWRGTFAVNSKDLVSGYAQIQSDLEKVLKYFDSKGVQRDSVGVSAVQNEALYKMSSEGSATNEIEGYRLSQTVTLQSNEISRIDKLSKESTVLIKDNIGFTSEQPEYYYTKIDDLKIEMLGEAAKDAKERAVRLAESSGNKVGALRSAQQGVFQITAQNSANVSDYGEYNTSAIEKSIKAVVTMQYSIQ
ncbi:MAG: SIMPL domain-containing protein [Deltaproteobacteria bacterium]|nr:SIMPL domain-containing protein [Deltaproteobacteria bacterium]